jgi:hypothetical protein
VIRRILLLMLIVLILLPSFVLAETFGLTSIGSNSGTMATWGTIYVTRSHRYIAHQYIAGSNDVFTEIWVYGDSTTDGNSTLSGALYGIDTPSGDSAIPDNRLVLTDTLGSVPDGLRWLRLNAKTDYTIAPNDTVTIAWAISENVVSRYEDSTRSTAMYETNSDPLPSDITPPATQNQMWSVFGCINQEGAGGSLGHAPTEYNLGGGSWLNPGNAVPSDEGLPDDNDQCATYDDKYQDPLVLHACDFTIPFEAILDSIEGCIQGLGTTSTPDSKRQIEVDLTVDSTNAFGISKVYQLPYSGVSSCNGTDVDSVFRTGLPTVAQVNGRGFGLWIRDNDSGANEIDIDAAWLTIYFHLPAEVGVNPRRKKILMEVIE